MIPGRVLEPFELIIMLIIAMGIGLFSFYKIKTENNKSTYNYYASFVTSILATIGLVVSPYHRIVNL